MACLRQLLSLNSNSMADVPGKIGFCKQRISQVGGPAVIEGFVVWVWNSACYRATNIVQPSKYQSCLHKLHACCDCMAAAVEPWAQDECR
jgi:hypothetical protein